MHPLPRSSPAIHPRVIVGNEEGLSSAWLSTRSRFLAAIPEHQRPAVETLLRDPHQGGRGLRAWLSSLTSQRSNLPAAIPSPLMQVYLEDNQAVPLHDCAACGVAIPVRPTWDMPEERPEQIYFAVCPCCGGATGLFAYWTRVEKESHQSAAPKSPPAFSES
jgi:hypothetical protein